MVYSFLIVAYSYPKWPSSVRAGAVIRARKHHFGISGKMVSTLWEKLTEKLSSF
jgi:hypothetical protein